MDMPHMNITAVFFSDDSAMQFSVYGPGWGYRAFSIPSTVICDQLGAANQNPKQLSLAFELGRPRILRAVQRATTPPDSEGRVTLLASDFS
jgi:hypothetical protein